MQSRWQDKISGHSSTPATTPSLAENEGLSTIVFITGEDMNGNPQWAYARIHADHYLAFKDAEANGNYHLADYGEVLRYGAGKEPPEAIKQEMKAQYDCNEQFEPEIQKMLEEIAEQLIAEDEENR
jgi:hypothetical protein